MSTQLQNNAPVSYPSSYREKQIGKVLYQVTSVFKGEFQLKDALEDLAVRRALKAATDTEN